jgi:hypothetical protein
MADLTLVAENSTRRKYMCVCVGGGQLGLWSEASMHMHAEVVQTAAVLHATCHMERVCRVGRSRSC